MQRRTGFRVGHHALAGELLDLRQRGEELGTVGGVGHVVGDGGAQQCTEVLRGVGQSGVGADRDALHALGAVLRDEERGFAAGHVLGGRVAGGGGDHAHGRERRGGLVVTEMSAELGVEVCKASERRALDLAGGQRVRAAA